LIAALKSWCGARQVLKNGGRFTVDEPDNHGHTPLYYATQSGQRKVVDFLLSSHASLVCGKGGTTALMEAAANNRVELLEVFTAHGCEVNAADKKGRTALSYAAAYGNLECAKWLLEHGAKLDIADRYNDAPLHWAVQEGHKAMVELLLASGDERTAVGSEGRLPASMTEDAAILAVLACPAESPSVAPIVTASESSNVDIPLEQLPVGPAVG
jgi:uncharacterized protein